MILDALHDVLNLYHDTVTGFRTAQVGRANNGFAHLIDHVSQHLAQQPGDAQARAAGVIRAMLAAKERNDAITLADLIQYELPGLLTGGEIDNSLFDMDIVTRLKRLDPLLGRGDGIVTLLRELQTIQHDHPQARGIACYHAAPLYRMQRHADTRALLAFDEEAGRRTPLGACAQALLYARDGDLVTAAALIDWAYVRCETLHDAYAEVAWIAAQQVDVATALELAARDENAGRLTSPWQLNVATLHARGGEFDHATRLVESAYEHNPALRDGLAGLACIKAESGDRLGAIDLAARDRELQRLGPQGHVRLALLHAQQGDFDAAVDLVATAYRLDGTLHDGYARLGWVKAGERDWEAAAGWLARDRNDDRLSPAWTLQLAVVEMYRGNPEQAARLVDDAYAADPALCDGHARLGWHGYLLGAGPAYLAAQTERDIDTRRNGLMGALYAALRCALDGDLEGAICRVENAYRDDNSQRNWLSTLGWLRVRHGDTARGRELLQRDFSVGRMDPDWQPTYAVALYLDGDRAAAARLLATTAPDDNRRSRVGFPTLPDLLIGYSELTRLVADDRPTHDLTELRRAFPAH